jgi:hypothetical protein
VSTPRPIESVAPVYSNQRTSGAATSTYFAVPTRNAKVPFTTWPSLDMVRHDTT